MSFLSTQYGWAANNVVDFEIVLANGTIVHATEKENTGNHRSPFSEVEQQLTQNRPLCKPEGRR